MFKNLDPHITLIIIGLALTLTGYLLGKYGSKSNVTTSEIVKVDEKYIENKDIHTHTVTSVDKLTTGETKTTTVIDTTITDKIVDKKDTNIDYQQTVTQHRPKINVSLLASYDVLHPSLAAPAYGLFINKEVLGTVTVGAFGLNNGVIGLSLGLDF